MALCFSVPMLFSLSACGSGSSTSDTDDYELSDSVEDTESSAEEISEIESEFESELDLEASMEESMEETGDVSAEENDVSDLMSLITIEVDDDACYIDGVGNYRIVGTITNAADAAVDVSIKMYGDLYYLDEYGDTAIMEDYSFDSLRAYSLYTNAFNALCGPFGWIEAGETREFEYELMYTVMDQLTEDVADVQSISFKPVMTDVQYSVEGTSKHYAMFSSFDEENNTWSYVSPTTGEKLFDVTIEGDYLYYDITIYNYTENYVKTSIVFNNVRNDSDIASSNGYHGTTTIDISVKPEGSNKEEDFYSVDMPTDWNRFVPYTYIEYVIDTDKETSSEETD